LAKWPYVYVCRGTASTAAARSVAMRSKASWELSSGLRGHAAGAVSGGLRPSTRLLVMSFFAPSRSPFNSATKPRSTNRSGMSGLMASALG
jgi:hypothetical protein